MTNELTNTHVHPLLSHILPTKNAIAVADWVKDKGFRVAGLDALGSEDIKDMDSGQRETLGDTIYDAYCHARGITRVYAPQNLSGGIDLVAVRFHFADGAVMSSRSTLLHTDVTARLQKFVWRYSYLVRQTLSDDDLHFAINTWFKAWREGWSDGQKAVFARCQEDHVKSSACIYPTEELFQATQELLSSWPDQEYTYNQVADALQIVASPAPGALPQRMAVKDVLERLSNPKQNIHEDVIKYVTRPVGKNKSATVYKWAPARRALDRNPSKRDFIIKGAVLEFVRQLPDCTTRAIYGGMRSAFGQIDKTSVDAALKALITDRKIEEPKVGPHRSFLHRVSVSPAQGLGLSTAAPKPENNAAPAQVKTADFAFDPDDIFGTERKADACEEPKNAKIRDLWRPLDQEAIARIAAKRQQPKPV